MGETQRLMTFRTGTVRTGTDIYGMMDAIGTVRLLEDLLYIIDQLLLLSQKNILKIAKTLPGKSTDTDPVKTETQ